MLIDPQLSAGPLRAVSYLPVTPVRAVQGRVPQEQAEEKGQDSLELSPSALARLADSLAIGAEDCEDCEEEEQEEQDAAAPRGADGEPLAPEEQEQLTEMKARDREVRAHEEAHKAAAGQLAAGGPSYEMETGPDGREYAVGGEVQIQLKEGRTPEESIRLAQQARRAALAPAEPSAQDLAVAAEASQREAAARAKAYQSNMAGGGGAASEGSQAGANATPGQPSLNGVFA